MTRRFGSLTFLAALALACSASDSGEAADTPAAPAAGEAPPAAASAPPPAAMSSGELSEDDKTIYALGLALARNLQPYGLDERELGVFQSGLNDALLGRETLVALEEYGPKLRAFGQARQARAAEAEKAASAEFLAAAAGAEGATRTASGLIKRVLTEGEGASPTVTDTVKVHYHGTLRDGTVFDSSVDRGQPATFPLNRVVPCWTEALQTMKVGEKAHITCPSDIAYGDRGSPPRIKPGAALAFDVELIEIVQKPEPPGEG